MHIFHKWNVIYRMELTNGRGWFEHRKCKICSKEKMLSRLSFFSTINDAVELGVYSGMYKAMYKAGWIGLMNRVNSKNGLGKQ